MSGVYYFVKGDDSMRIFIRGILYALSLNILNFLIGELTPPEAHGVLGFVVFLAVGMYFLKSDTISEMLQCGFTALPFLFVIQIWLLGLSIYTEYLFDIYVPGLFGTITAVIFTTFFILTGKYEKKERGTVMEEYEVFDKKLKIKMLVYALITAISFIYLVMCDGAGVSAFIFALLQGIMLAFVVPEKRRLLWLIPIGVLCLNSFISANEIWRVPNFIVCIVLYACMFTPVDFKDVTVKFFAETFERIFAPLGTAVKPFEWTLDMTEGKKGYVKRGAIALVISLVAVCVLSAVLSSADMVFSHSIDSILESFGDILSVETLWKIVAGALVGIYLFGILYNAYVDYVVERREVKIKGDVFIITCVMLSTLAVYTIFVAIQFKYLFCGSELPYGLNVTEYARKGFFELLGLTCVNIAAILIVTKLTEHVRGKKAVFVKSMNMYLCAVTVVLLASSFYRMWLYNETDGLTRLRFLVFGFLAFEFIGLVATFFYIAKPKFNIVMVYGALALCYYLVLNVIPMDAVVAKNQVDRYLNGEREELDYVWTLSIDAAGEVDRVRRARVKHSIKAKYWLKDEYEECCDEYNGWRSFNLSEYRLGEICEGIK